MQGTYYNRPMYTGMDARLSLESITPNRQSLPYTAVYKGEKLGNLSSDVIKNGRKCLTAPNILLNKAMGNLSAIRLLKNNKFSKEKILQPSSNGKEKSPELSAYEQLHKVHNSVAPLTLGNGYLRRSFTSLESRNSGYETNKVVSTSLPNGLRYPFLNSRGTTDNSSSRRSFYQHYLKYLEDEGEDSGEINPYRNYGQNFGIQQRRLISDSAMLTSSGTEEIPKYELYNPDLMSGGQLDSLHGADRCSFGSVSNKLVLKNLLTPKRKDCRCAATTNLDFDDLICGWDSKSQMNKYQRQPKAKTRRNPYIGIPPSYRRLLDKDREFEFQHYSEIKDYIRQYRYNHTVGDVCRQDEEGFPIATPDPYIARLKSNAAALAEHFNSLAIFSMDKERVARDTGDCQQDAQSKDLPKSDEEGTEDGDNALSMDDRGRGINLAPVRRITTRPRVDKMDVKRSKRSQNTHSQYLNLVIPKTTLHRTNLQLNITRELGPAFEPSKQVFVPYKPIMKRTSSADMELFRKQKPDSVRNVLSSPGNRPSDLQLTRANTVHGNPALSFQIGNVLGSEPGIFVPPHRMTAIPASAGRIQRNSSRSQDGRIYPSAITNKEEMKAAIYNKINEAYTKPSQDQVQEIWEGGDRLSDALTKDKVVAVSGSGLLGIRGKTCNSEDHMTLAYKLKKDRQRRVGASAVN